MLQSFNFRSKTKLMPFCNLVAAAITAEELGYVELVSHGIAMLANGPDKPGTDEQDGGDVSNAQDNATGREVCGYLLVRGSVHAHAMRWR